MALLRRVALIVILVAAALPADLPVAEAHHPAGTEFKSGPDHEFGEMVAYPMVFPVDGPHTLSDWFWALRSGGSIHHGQDIMAAKMTPVLAAADGVVVFVNWSSNPDNLNPHRCCSLVILHDDGWRSWYLHLNDDSAADACDGEGWGIVDGIVPGTPVSAGQHIGWVGNSGNASCNAPHLHFELHDPHGVIVNPYWSLKNPVTPEQLAAIDWMFETGITRGCNPPENTQYCPERLVTRAEMATFLTRAFGLATSQDDGPFIDHLSNIHRTAINAVRIAGVTIGCNPPQNTRFCPRGTLTRAEIATFIARYANLPTPATGHYTDISGHWGQNPVNAMAEAGIAWACNPPDNDRFCPNASITRGEMALWLYRTWQHGYLPHFGEPDGD